MTPGLIKDRYCRSPRHIFMGFRNIVCKNWDAEHPAEAAHSKGEDKVAQAASANSGAGVGVGEAVEEGAREVRQGGGKRGHNGGDGNAPASSSSSSMDDIDDDEPSPTPSRASSPHNGGGSNGRPTPTSRNGPTGTPNDDPNHTHVAATSLPPVPGSSPFPPTLPAASPSTKTAASDSAANASSVPTGAIVGVVVGACVAALIVAGFLVHHRRKSNRTAAALAARLKAAESGEVFKPDVGGHGAATHEDFSAAPPGLLDLSRDVLVGGMMTPVPLDGGSHAPQSQRRMSRAAMMAMASTAAELNNTAGNRGSWPIRPKPGSGSRPGHTRTPTRDIIFVSNGHDDDDAMPIGLHVNNAVAARPTSSSSYGSAHDNDREVFGTPIYDDLAATINAATQAVLASGQTSPRSVIMRSSASSSASDSKRAVPPMIAAAVMEDRHSMEWPNDDMDDPVAMMRMEEELRLLQRTASFNGAPPRAEEFPGVPSVDPTDPRLKKL